LQVLDGGSEECGVVPELAEAAVAVEAEDPPHRSGGVVVVDVLRVALPQMA
jgi:hypothetical protein